MSTEPPRGPSTHDSVSTPQSARRKPTRTHTNTVEARPEPPSSVPPSASTVGDDSAAQRVAVGNDTQPHAGHRLDFGGNAPSFSQNAYIPDATATSYSAGTTASVAAVVPIFNVHGNPVATPPASLTAKATTGARPTGPPPGRRGVKRALTAATASRARDAVVALSPVLTANAAVPAVVATANVEIETRSVTDTASNSSSNFASASVSASASASASAAAVESPVSADDSVASASASASVPDFSAASASASVSDWASVPDSTSAAASTATAAAPPSVAGSVALGSGSSSSIGSAVGSRRPSPYPIPSLSVPSPSFVYSISASVSVAGPAADSASLANALPVDGMEAAAAFLMREDNNNATPAAQINNTDASAPSASLSSDLIEQQQPHQQPQLQPQQQQQQQQQQ